MTMTFKLWSELNPKAKKELKPDFGLRNWNSLDDDEKYKIWKYLEEWFFLGIDTDILIEYIFRGTKKSRYKFYGEYPENKKKEKRIYFSIKALNDEHKAKSYAKSFLEDKTLDSACHDFYEIFMNQDENVVMELLSLYSLLLISERAEGTIHKKEGESEEEYNQRLENWRWEEFDKFRKDLNEVFTDFEINLYLTRQGFAPRQEEKIIKEIYEPVLNYLSHSKWTEVSKILSDAFDEYRKNTPQGYSNCVTNVISAIQAFLQIVVNGKTGKGEISKLIPIAQKKKLIPDDFFTQKIFDNLESVFARQRQETGIAHPKKQYANEKNARLMLNLAMVFLQHCIQK